MKYKLKKISGDASFREFYRLEKKNKTSIIVCAKKEKFKNLIVYAVVNKILNVNKINAPKLLNNHYSNDMIEISDLGEKSFYDYVISKKSKLNDCLFVTGGKIIKEPDLPYRKSGCAALDMAYVAAGRYDGYFQHNLNLWDIAAGIIILKEAGGFVEFFQEDINVPLKKNILATNSNIHQELRDLINKKDIE